MGINQRRFPRSTLIGGILFSSLSVLLGFMMRAQLVVLSALLNAESGEKRALLDILRCMGLNASGYLEGRSSAERQSHFTVLAERIDAVTPQNISYLTSCFGGYCGAWIEDLWGELRSADPSVFGLCVPLFAPWLRVKLFYGYLYNLYVAQVFAMLSHGCVYCTISQHGWGIASIVPRNLLVLSSGGVGHIPILLFKWQLNSSSYPIGVNYQWVASFMGSIDHGRVRYRMASVLRQLFGSDFYCGRGSNWTWISSRSKFIMAPRGISRNSFRLTETLQMGMVPVYVYDDLIWLPYYDSIGWSHIGFLSHIDHLPQLALSLKNVPIWRVAEMRKNIISLYSTHFTMKAAIDQSLAFFQYGFSKSDLRCSTYRPN
jgi:hypothetical protein